MHWENCKRIYISGHFYIVSIQFLKSLEYFPEPVVVLIRVNKTRMHNVEILSSTSKFKLFPDLDCKTSVSVEHFAICFSLYIMVVLKWKLQIGQC